MKTLCFLILILFFKISFTQDPGAKITFKLVRIGDTVKLDVDNRGGIDEWRKTDDSNRPLKPFHGSVIAHGYNYSCKGSRCVFTILRISPETAGTYQYRWSVNGDPFSLYYKLIIADLACKLKVPKTLIGSNDCQSVQPEGIVGTCTLLYSSNDQFSPSLKWRVKGVDGVVMSESGDLSKPIALHNLPGTQVWELRDEIALRKKGEEYECYIEGDNLSCSETFVPNKILYAFNKTADDLQSQHLQPMTSANKRSVTCRADKSDSVQCSYRWEHQVGNVRTQFKGAVLHQDNLKTFGTYECLASCTLKQHAPEQCVLLADSFEYQASQSANLLYIIPLVLLVAILIAVVLFMVYKARRRKSKKKVESKEMQLLPTTTTIPATTATTILPPPATTATTIPPPATTTTSTELTSTPMPQSKPSLQNTQRRSSFKRSSSNKSLMEKIIEEDNKAGTVSTRLPRITINDSKGSVMGVGLLGGRIFCVCSDSARLFVYHKDPPHNRIIPEEVIVDGLKKATDLAVCSKSYSVFICQYTDEKSIFRVYPKVSRAENQICRGSVDGNPASISLVGGGEETAVVVLKRHKRMHVELYSTSKCKNEHGLVESFSAWEKRVVFELTPEVTLPLKACVSEEAPRDATPTNRCLCLLYGSGKLVGKRFEKYVLAHYVLQTGRFLGKTFEVSCISPSFTPSSLVTDTSRGGVCVLREGGNGGLWHLEHGLKTFKSLLPLENPGIRFCLNHHFAVVACSSKPNASLLCKQIEYPPSPCV